MMLKLLSSKLMRKRASFVMTLTMVLGLFVQLLGYAEVQAANFQQVYVRYDRMKVSTSDPGVLVVLTPQTAGTEAEVELVFPAGYTVDAACTVAVTNLPDGVTAMPTSGSFACAGSGQVVSITNVSDLTVATSYGIRVVTGVDLPALAGQYEVTARTLTSGAATIDTSNVATRVITDDQIVITATVPPTFNFTLSANSDTFTLDLDVANVVSTNGVTATMVTNAGNGWVAFMRSQNAALSSAITGDSIATVGTVNDSATTTLTAGTEGYVVDVNLTTDSADLDSGVVTIDPDYNGATTSAGGTLSTTHQLIASANGPTDIDVITLIARATIDGLTQAADDYTDTLTVVGAGNF